MYGEFIMHRWQMLLIGHLWLLKKSLKIKFANLTHFSFDGKNLREWGGEKRGLTKIQWPKV